MTQKTENRNYLKPMTWYVAEVAFSSNNPIHHCIAFHRNAGNLELIGSYHLEDMPVRKHISQLAYFRPIHDLPEMAEPSKHFLVSDVQPIVIYIEVPKTED